MAVRDVVIISVILFTFAVAFFAINFVSNRIISEVTSIATINESTAAVEAFQGIETNVNARMDYLFFGLFIGLALAIIITGWFISGVPIFTFIYILITVLAVIFSSLFTYVWDLTANASVFGTTLSRLPITNHIMMFLPLYIAVIGFIGVIVMFAKPLFYGEE